MSGRPLSYLASLPVDQVKGIGPVSSKKLGEAGIHSVAHLLLHVPRRYLDRSEMYALADVPLDNEVTVSGTVQSFTDRHLRGRRGVRLFTAVIADGTGTLKAIWFRRYMKLEVGSQVALSGKLERFRGRLQMKSPDLDALDAESLVTARIVPVHPSAGGLGPVKLRDAVANAIKRSRPIDEVVPVDILTRLDLVDRDTAIENIHFPDSAEAAAAARKRLVFDELFRLEVALAMRKRAQVAESVGVAHRREGPLFDRFLSALPYDLTGAQFRVLEETATDMVEGHPMHRLLQGEVGSGKTVVAVATMLMAVQSEYQAAVMAPTEVLAEQHYLAIRELLAAAGFAPDVEDPDAPDGTGSLFTANSDGERPMVRLALLTSNSSEANFLPVGTARRSDVVEAIAGGAVDMIVGTHALIQEELRFDRLGAAVVDEQHRFGVYQRVSLRGKARGYDPDLLIMTATPIPRTLAMTLYGDLDVSVLDEMPPGRTPVVTEHVPPDGEAISAVYDHVRREVEAGRQVFVVCPLVDESDKLQVASATSEYERLRGVFPDLELGLLHGQLRPADKDGVMQRFRDREIDVLVATTVIEVGIDISNASIMIIEDADRFGLSQLHQLRGRVGRGPYRSYCYLVADPTTPEGEQRIAAMVASADGFYLAEEDLRIRGQGTVFGTKQAGVKDLKLADILADAEVLIDARREAFALVQRDPDLAAHPEIAEEVRVLLGEDAEWLFVS